MAVKENKLLWKPHAPAVSTPTACVRGGDASKIGKSGQMTPGPKQIKNMGCKMEHPKSGPPGQEPREFEFEQL